MKIEERIEWAIKRCRREAEAGHHYPYLDAIVETLELIQTCVHSDNCDKEQGKKWLGGLIRLVTEDHSFAESDLGTEILEAMSAFDAYLEQMN